MAGRWTVAVVLAVATTLLAGCSGSTPQASTTLPSTSAPTSASPTLPPLGPADFPVPAEARQRNVDGVIAFAGYYVRLVDRSSKDLDSSSIRSLSRNCALCSQLANQWDHAKAAGQKIDGGELTLVSTGGPVLSGEHAEIPTYLQQDALTYRDSSGSPVAGRSSATVRLTGGLTLAWDAPRFTWVVTQFDADPV